MSNNDTKIRPVPGYILVEPQKKEKTTVSGIVLPDSHDEKPQQGTVLYTGGDYKNEHDVLRECPVKVGDVVIYREWGGKEYKEGERDLLLLKYEDIMAKVIK